MVYTFTKKKKIASISIVTDICDYFQYAVNCLRVSYIIACILFLNNSPSEWRNSCIKELSAVTNDICCFIDKTIEASEVLFRNFQSF